MGYEFRIYNGNEVHIFEDGSSFSICRRVSRNDTEELGIYEGSSKKLRFSGLWKGQAQDLVSALESLGVNVCGTCVSHLHRTIGR